MLAKQFSFLDLFASTGLGMIFPEQLPSMLRRARLSIRLRAVMFAFVLVGLCAGFSALMPDVLRVGAFSDQDPAQTLPDGWERIAFDDIENKTRYDLVRSDGSIVLRARSDGGASGLATSQRIDLAEYPILEWRWKVDGIVEEGNARMKEGDDYAARLYVTFDYDHLGFIDRAKLVVLRALGYDEIPTRALNYVWANRIERGAILENAYTDWVMMLAVRSGPRSVGKWVTERRNVLSDYRAAFGGDPPPVNGIALMTDTDNTGGEATTYYGDIVFRSGDDQGAR